MNQIELEQNSADAPEKPSLAKQVIKQVIGVALAGAFLYFAFRDANFKELLHYSQNLDLSFLLLVFASSIFSHILRAWRWVILLQPLAQHKISLWNSFSAVVYGYAVNVVLPRGGEVARLISISKTEKIPWAGVLPTMFIDRLLDIAMLVLLLGLTITSLPMGELKQPWLFQAGVAMCIATVIGIVMLPFVGRIIRSLIAFDFVKKSLPQNIAQKIEELSTQFDLGTSSLKNPANLPTIGILSFCIWGLYWCNTYFMLLAFHLGEQVSMVKALMIFTIGSVGVLVPTPGSVGSYHFLVSQALQKTAGVNPDQALAYATVLHIFSFVIASCVPAAFCFVVQFISSQRAKNKIS